MQSGIYAQPKHLTKVSSFRNAANQSKCLNQPHHQSAIKIPNWKEKKRCGSSNKIDEMIKKKKKN